MNAEKSTAVPSHRRRARHLHVHSAITPPECSTEMGAGESLAAYGQFLEDELFCKAAKTIFDCCKAVTGATSGYIALLSADGTENKVGYLDPVDRPCTVDPSLPMPMRGLRAEAYRTGKVVCENNFADSPSEQFLPEGHATLDNALFAPMVVAGKVAGVIGLANKPGGFSEADRQAAERFGRLAAIAVMNSWMFKSLERSEERYRHVVETARDAIITTDDQGTVLQWNDGAKRMFGLSEDEAVGSPVSTVLPHFHGDEHHEGLQCLVSDGETNPSKNSVESVGLRKDSFTFPVELSVAAWQVGEQSRFTTIIHDITSHKRAEGELLEHSEHLRQAVEDRTVELIQTNDQLTQRIAERRRVEDALRESESQYRSLVESTHTIPWRFDLATEKFTYMGRQVESVLGYAAESWIDADIWASRIHPEDRERAIRECVEATQRGEDHSLEYRAIAADDHIVWIQDHVSVAMGNEEPKELLGFMFDITERKQAVEALQQSEGRRLQAEKLAVMGKAAARIAHEINNPLAGIRNICRLVQETVPKEHHCHKWVQKLDNEVGRVAEIIQQMLDLNRPQRQVESDVPLEELLVEVVDMAEPAAGKRRIVIQVAADNLPTKVRLADKLVRQVLLNLLVNAIDASPDGEVVDLSVVAVSVAAEQQLQFTVADQGPGIPEEIRTRIFDPFFSTKSKSEGGGLGLGLSISKTIAESLGGSLELRVLVGKGCVFQFSIPLLPAAEEDD